MNNSNTNSMLKWPISMCALVPLGQPSLASLQIHGSSLALPHLRYKTYRPDPHRFEQHFFQKLQISTEELEDTQHVSPYITKRAGFTQFQCFKTSVKDPSAYAPGAREKARPNNLPNLFHHWEPRTGRILPYFPDPSIWPLITKHSQ